MNDDTYEEELYATSVVSDLAVSRFGESAT
jgi:hypothetical protein